MSKGPQRVRGTQDIWGEEADRFQRVVAAFERVRRLYGFTRVEMPVFEATQVFARSIGETTDIVSKEMYSFEDRGGDSLTLRPEFTAGICRAFLSEGWQQLAPLKIATHGPAFRYERPQKGRYRQFHQLDAEIIGAGEPAADVELMVMADQLLNELGIAEGVTLQLNTLGDDETRGSWRSALVVHFEAHKDALSDESRSRLDRNPLRILDSKDPRDRPIIESAPGIDMYFTADAAAFFDEVERGLRAAGVPFERNPRLVRGLDYYRHTAFEFVTDRLGAQGSVLAGGRYDGLIEALGGPHTPAVGWAAGIERLAMLLSETDKAPLLAIVPNREVDGGVSGAILDLLRRSGVPAAMAYKGNPKRHFEIARKKGATGTLTVDTVRQVMGEHGEVAELTLHPVRADDPQWADLKQRVVDALGAQFVLRTFTESEDLISNSHWYVFPQT